MKHSVTQKVWLGEVELYPSLNKSQAVVFSISHLIYCTDLQLPNENVWPRDEATTQGSVSQSWYEGRRQFFCLFVCFALVAPCYLAHFLPQSNQQERDTEIRTFQCWLSRLNVTPKQRVDVFEEENRKRKREANNNNFLGGSIMWVGWGAG